MLKPIIKWAGGKTQLVDYLIDKLPLNLLNDLSDDNKQIRYFEPFLGSGAMMLALQPKRAIVNDINQALINMYQVVSDQAKVQCNSLCQKINVLDAAAASYYDHRKLFNQKLKQNQYDESLAALFIFLNKHCFNGLYRVNSNGEFNVPYNSSIRKSVDISNLINVAKYLNQHVTLNCGDFAIITQQVSSGDLVFIDSPYPPLRDKTFSEYNAIKFTDEDHKRLAVECKRLDQLKAYVIITNHDTPLIRNLYQSFNINKVKVQRNINSNSANRTSEEIIITNF